MLTHKQVWDGIDRLAAAHKLSASGLAKKAGLDPTTFNKSKRITKQGKARWPSTESLSKILEATGSAMREFVELMHGEGKGGTALATRLRCMALSDIDKSGSLDSSGFPVGNAWEDIEHPAIEDENAYAIELDRDIAPPCYRSGDIAVVAPGSSIRRSDRLIARHRRGELLFGVLVRRTAQRVVLSDLSGSGAEENYDADEILWMARIVLISQ